MKRLLIILALCAAWTISSVAAPKSRTVVLTPPPNLTGSEEVQIPVVFPHDADPSQLNEVDVIGATTIIGTTWYDWVSSGTVGRMIDLDSSGYLHFVWTKGLDAGSANRHVYYNAVDPTGIQVIPGTGIQIDASQRAGFPVVDVGFGGRAFAAFHQIYLGANYHTAVGYDYLPHVGAFQCFETPWLYQGGMDVQIIWPKMQLGRDGRIHVTATENIGVAGELQRVFYTYGLYNPVTAIITFPAAPNTWTFVDSSLTVASDVATSKASNRVAFGWTRPRDEDIPGWEYAGMDNDIHILIDDDGLNPDFSQAINLTDFVPPNLNYLPDTTLANMDTLRAWSDMSLFFDQNDWLHVAFTTRAFFVLEGWTYWHPSIIWHWSEEFPQDFTMIHNAFDDYLWNYVDCGAWNVKAQRPSLGQDPETGYLYCAYQVYDTDTLHLSQGGYPSGETYVSVSTDGGQSWAVGTNITQTITPADALAGHCKSEQAPSLADWVDGFCRIEYQFDKDAGASVQMEGMATLNPIVYHKVPVGMIQTAPLVEQNVPFHVEQADLTVHPSLEMTPLSAPVIVPAAGGSFSFMVSTQNPENTSQTVDLWIRAVLPNGNTTIPVLGPIQVVLTPGNRVWLRTQNVPSSAPAGNYIYKGYLGDYPNPIWSTDSFPFTKLATGDGQLLNNWDNGGEPFGEGGTHSIASPEQFALLGASPNPFNPTTAISYQLSANSFVTLKVYDTAGRLVATLVDGWREAGTHEATFDGSNLASGIYVYHLTAGSFTASGKMVLMK